MMTEWMLLECLLTWLHPVFVSQSILFSSQNSCTLSAIIICYLRIFCA